MSSWNRTWFFIAIGLLPVAIALGALGGAQSANGLRIDDAVVQGYANPQCRPFIEMPAGYGIKPGPGMSDPCRALYLYRSSYSDAASTRGAYIERMQERQREEMYFFVGGTLAYWMFGVGLLYAVGRIAAWRSRDPVRTVLGMSVLAAAWGSALAIEMSTRLMARAYQAFGADLPGPTLIALGAVQAYVPWILAAAVTLLIPLAARRAQNYFPHACAAAASVLAIALVAIAFALLLPVVAGCSLKWPAWPTSSAGPSGAAEQAQTPAQNAGRQDGPLDASCG